MYIISYNLMTLHSLCNRFSCIWTNPGLIIVDLNKLLHVNHFILDYKMKKNVDSINFREKEGRTRERSVRTGKLKEMYILGILYGTY